MTFSPISAFLLFPAMLVLLELGHRLQLGERAKPRSTEIESVVFALFGLLLAFTFSGAMARYDVHREMVVQETNSIGRAYLLLDLLPPDSQQPLRREFLDYTNSRLHLYETVAPEISVKTMQLQKTIWQQAITAVNAPGANPEATKLLLPALNEMID